MDTIAAVSTPMGSGAIGIIRLSGEQSLRLALRFFSCGKIKNAADVIPNYMQLGTFNSGGFNERCLMVYFKAPRSYTGEDMVEFHVHGGAVLTQEVLNCLLCAGARLAERGEFTKRAYLSGKVTLDAAEGVAGMINADSEAELRAAYSLMSGRFDGRIAELTDMLTEVLSTMEASLDYPEEMADEVDDSYAKACEVAEKMRALLAGAAKGKLIKNGVRVAICGSTNVGKSSLLNAIVGYSRAIVTSVHGTTRDVIEQSYCYDGVKLVFLDTAGLRSSDDEVENIGMERSVAAAKSADVVLWVHADDETDANKAEYAALLADCKCVIKVNNKTDVYKSRADMVNVSAKTGEGVRELLSKIIESTVGRTLVSDVLTEERHVDAVRRANAGLCAALENFCSEARECVLVDLRAAINALAEISGGGATERVINDVFSRFCVGK